MKFGLEARCSMGNRLNITVNYIAAFCSSMPRKPKSAGKVGIASFSPDQKFSQQSLQKHNKDHFPWYLLPNISTFIFRLDTQQAGKPCFTRICCWKWKKKRAASDRTGYNCKHLIQIMWLTLERNQVDSENTMKFCLQACANVFFHRNYHRNPLPGSMSCPSKERKKDVAYQLFFSPTFSPQSWSSVWSFWIFSEKLGCVAFGPCNDKLN